MKSHLQNLLEHVPDLLSRKILDIGSGKGGFIIEAAIKGANVFGLEKNKEYIEETLKNAEQNNVVVRVKEGVAEALPFESKEFGFLNIAEVIEHVESPDRLIEEAYRVLNDGGAAYISVPNRFSMKDPHFHLYFVNWLPRFASDAFISLFGKHKNYTGNAGRQRLREMHYYRFSDIKKKLSENGFSVVDIRESKIKKRFKGVFGAAVFIIYKLLLRSFYFDTFHILLRK